GGLVATVRGSSRAASNWADPLSRYLITALWSPTPPAPAGAAGAAVRRQHLLHEGHDPPRPGTAVRALRRPPSPPRWAPEHRGRVDAGDGPSGAPGERPRLRQPPRQRADSLPHLRPRGHGVRAVRALLARDRRMVAARGALDRFIDRAIDEHLAHPKPVDAAGADMVDGMLAFLVDMPVSADRVSTDSSAHGSTLRLTRDNIKATIMVK
uniref:Uncharacterized protein n=1 Tax=Aegilops tauschii subsp. strangulata TaxID=200361 RepID=A0A453CJI4_AEGTS